MRQVHPATTNIHCSTGEEWHAVVWKVEYDVCGAAIRSKDSLKGVSLHRQKVSSSQFMLTQQIHIMPIFKLEYPCIMLEYPCIMLEYPCIMLEYPCIMLEYPCIMLEYPCIMLEYPCIMLEYPCIMLEYPCIMLEYPSLQPAKLHAVTAIYRSKPFIQTVDFNSFTQLSTHVYRYFYGYLSY